MNQTEIHYLSHCAAFTYSYFQVDREPVGYEHGLRQFLHFCLHADITKVLDLAR